MNDYTGWTNRRPARKDTAVEELTFPGPPAWTEAALCAQIDSEIFFPEKGGSTREAKKVCGMCEVVADCLAYAIANQERYGLWGGKSERERRAIADGAAA